MGVQVHGELAVRPETRSFLVAVVEIRAAVHLLPGPPLNVTVQTQSVHRICAVYETQH